MKTLPRYLLRQVLASLALTVAVFTFVLLLGSVLKELLPLLVSGQVKFGLLFQAFGLLIPFVGAFALPMGMLTATLLVFGRFSADQELTAARASGVSLLSIITPILFAALLLCGASAAVNMEIAPRCRVVYKEIRTDLRSAMANIQLPEGRFITLPGNEEQHEYYVIYVAKNQNGKLRDVLLYQLKNETNTETAIHAPSGQVELDTTNQQIILHLHDARCVFLPSGSILSANNVNITNYLNSQKSGGGQVDITDLTFPQLRSQLRDLERRISSPIPTGRLSPEKLRALRAELAKQHDEMTLPIRVQIHRHVAFSFACFGFTLIGIPLGVRVQRRETNIGVAIALGLVAFYYAFFILAESLSTKPELMPYLLVWVPNFIFQAVGAVLLWRANKGI